MPKNFYVPKDMLPRSYDEKTQTYTMYYRVKNIVGVTDKQYLYVSPDDINYIVHWVGRYVSDIVAMQVTNVNNLYSELEPNKSYPKSGLTGEQNSPLSYAAGLFSNRVRNPDEDFTKKQLRFISTLFKRLHIIYGQYLPRKELGFDSKTGLYNDPPMRIKFKEC